MSRTILILPGDGIGPEVMPEAVNVLEGVRGPERPAPGPCSRGRLVGQGTGAHDRAALRTAGSVPLNAQRGDSLPQPGRTSRRGEFRF